MGSEEEGRSVCHQSVSSRLKGVPTSERDRSESLLNVVELLLDKVLVPFQLIDLVRLDPCISLDQSRSRESLLWCRQSRSRVPDSSTGHPPAAATQGPPAEPRSTSAQRSQARCWVRNNGEGAPRLCERQFLIHESVIRTSFLPLRSLPPCASGAQYLLENPDPAQQLAHE